MQLYSPFKVRAIIFCQMPAVFHFTRPSGNAKNVRTGMMRLHYQAQQNAQKSLSLPAFCVNAETLARACRNAGVAGKIHIDRKASCYLMQDDYHQPFLNIHELMTVACNLKLLPGTRHEPIITDILTNLNLNHRRRVRAVELSGGEKRRLSIALELVANPTIFFLDEPTSGLDEVNAAQCVRLLKSLAQQGKTVVCTIHQPSAGTFALFDQVFVLARGQCVYQGGPLELVPFLRHVHMECPKHYSPSDYIIELCDSDDGALVPQMAHVTQNGKLMVCPMADASAGGGSVLLQMRNAVTQLQVQFAGRPKRTTTMTTTREAGGSSIAGGSVALLEKMKALTKFMHSDAGEEATTVTGGQQFAVLLHLMLLKIWRNRTVLVIQLFHHVFCGLIFGLIFFRAANEGQRMFDHLKFCIGVVFFVAYTQVIVPVLACKLPHLLLL